MFRKTLDIILIISFPIQELRNIFLVGRYVLLAHLLVFLGCIKRVTLEYVLSLPQQGMQIWSCVDTDQQRKTQSTEYCPGWL